MPASTSLQSLLDELYQLDPSLRQHEPRLRVVLEKLLLAQPHFSPSPDTLYQLKQKLMTEPRPAMNRRAPLFAIPAIAIVAVVIYVATQQSPQQTNTPPARSSAISIDTTKENAFGDFLTGQRQSTTTTTSSDKESSGAGDSATSSSLIARPADFVSYTYSITGEYSLPTLAVLKRQKGLSGGSSLSASSLFSTSSFSGLRLDSVTASQTTDDGYSVSIDYRDGLVSIYRQSSLSSKDLIAETRPSGTSTSESSMTTVSDETALSVAKKFLSDHKISVDGYDQPFVVKPIATNEMLKTMQGMEAQVIFPWNINGQPVYDDNGQRFGLTVGVAGDEKVQSVYNLMPLSFQASTYATVTDRAKIADYTKRGGWMYSSVPTGGKVETISLSAPTSGYLFSRYTLEQGTGDFLVPAIIFPLTPEQQLKTYRYGVVVPLLADLLNPAVSTPSPDVLPLQVEPDSGDAAE